MVKFSWIRWLVYFVIAMLALAAAKAVLSKIQFPASYLFSLIIMSLQTLTVLAFLYYAILAIFWGKKTGRRRFLLVFSSSFICLIALFETLFSFWMSHPAKIPPGFGWACKYYYDSYNFRILQYEKKLIAHDSQLLYTLKPAIKEDFKNAEFTTGVSTNRLGLRDDEGSITAPEIICLGDSFTMGWGIDEPETFSAMIEKSTGKKVLNAGIPSYGTVRELMLLDRLDLSALKYLVIQYCSNDIEENDAFIKENYHLSLTSFADYASLMNSYALSRKYFPARNFSLISQVWMKQQVNRLYPVFKLSGQPYSEEFKSDQHASAFLKVLLHFREKLKKVKIIVTNVDIYKYHNNQFIEELQRMFQQDPEAAGMGNVVFVNTAQDLVKEDYFILDYHIRPSGQRKIADKLLQEIR